MERADKVLTDVTIGTALAEWGGNPKDAVVDVYGLTPITVRADFTWDGRDERASIWRGLLNRNEYSASQGFAIARRYETGCHRFIAPSRPALERYQILAWNSVFYVCSASGQPCGSQLPDRNQLRFVLERAGTSLPDIEDLTWLP